MAIDSLNATDSYATYLDNRSTSVGQSAASGSRINNSADDAAGQAIVSALTAQIDGQDMAIKNANTGINLIQTADAASQSITEQLQYLNDLSVQAQNGTYSASQRDMLNQAFQQGMEGLNQIAESTSFNGISLLNADTSTVDIALDTNSRSTIDLPNLTIDALGLTGSNLTTPDQAAATQALLTEALGLTTDSQAQFGAQQNGLTAAVDTIANQNLNAMASRSQINDADMAQVYAEQNRQQVLNNAGVAMQAQNNQSYESVLALLG